MQPAGTTGPGELSRCEATAAAQQVQILPPQNHCQTALPDRLSLLLAADCLVTQTPEDHLHRKICAIQLKPSTEYASKNNNMQTFNKGFARFFGLDRGIVECGTDLCCLDGFLAMEVLPQLQAPEYLDHQTHPECVVHFSRQRTWTASMLTSLQRQGSSFYCLCCADQDRI